MSDDEFYSDDYIIDDPTQEEIDDYCNFLGLDPKKDPDLLWIAKEALMAPLPEGWKMYHSKKDENMQFFFNQNTGESLYEFPLDNYYRELYEKEKKKKDECLKMQAAKQNASNSSSAFNQNKNESKKSGSFKNSEKNSSKSSTSLVPQIKEQPSPFEISDNEDESSGIEEQKKENESKNSTLSNDVSKKNSKPPPIPKLPMMRTLSQSIISLGPQKHSSNSPSNKSISNSNAKNNIKTNNNINNTKKPFSMQNNIMKNTIPISAEFRTEKNSSPSSVEKQKQIQKKQEEDFQNEMNHIKELHQKDLKALQDQNKEEIELEKERNKRELQKLRQEHETAKQEIESQKEKNKRELQKLQQEYEATKQEILDLQHEADLAKKDAEMAFKNAENERDKKRISENQAEDDRRAAEDAARKARRLKEEREREANDEENTLKIIREKRQQRERELKELETQTTTQQQEELNKLKSNHEARMKEIEKNNKLEEEEIKTTKKAELEQLEIKWNKKIEKRKLDLKSINDDLEAAYNAKTSELTKAQNEANKMHQQAKIKLEKMKLAHQKRIKEIKEKAEQQVQEAYSKQFKFIEDKQKEDLAKLESSNRRDLAHKKMEFQNQVIKAQRESQKQMEIQKRNYLDELEEFRNQIEAEKENILKDSNANTYPGKFSKQLINQNDENIPPIIKVSKTHKIPKSIPELEIETFKCFSIRPISKTKIQKPMKKSQHPILKLRPSKPFSISLFDNIEEEIIEPHKSIKMKLTKSSTIFSNEPGRNTETIGIDQIDIDYNKRAKESLQFDLDDLNDSDDLQEINSLPLSRLNKSVSKIQRNLDSSSRKMSISIGGTFNEFNSIKKAMKNIISDQKLSVQKLSTEFSSKTIEIQRKINKSVTELEESFKSAINTLSSTTQPAETIFESPFIYESFSPEKDQLIQYIDY